MSYTDYTLDHLETQFKIKNTVQVLFDGITPISISPSLKSFLEDIEDLPIKSEKARSELIVMPILLDLRKQNNKLFTIYSGERLNVKPEAGLVEECDFILAKNTTSFTVNTPIITLVEAKKNDIELGIAQCAAQMYGAFLLNQQKGNDIPHIYGCVTTGEVWKFMKLEEFLLTIDQKVYFINDLNTILGIFQHILDFHK